MMIRLLFLLLFILCRPLPVLGALAVGNISSADAEAFTTSLSFSHNNNASGNTILVVAVLTRGITGYASSVTYNGVALTAVCQHVQTVTARAELWYLLAPATGTNTLAITTPSSGAIVGIAMSVSGAHQSTTWGTPATAGTEGGTSLSTNVSSAVGELVIDALMRRDDSQSVPVAGAGQTDNDTLDKTETSVGDGLHGGLSTEAGATTTTMSWSWTTSNFAVLCAAPLKPAAEATTLRRRSIYVQ